MPATSPAITRQANTLACLPPHLITASLNTRIKAAYLQDGARQAVAHDFNARLITELREQGVWPERRQR